MLFANTSESLAAGKTFGSLEVLTGFPYRGPEPAAPVGSPVTRGTSPRSSNRMRFGIKDDTVKGERLWRREQEIKIFKSLGKEKALH